MGFRNDTPINDINEYIKARADNYFRRVVRTMKYIGELCVKQARNSDAKVKDFKDDTGNLRSSIGYVVVHNGSILYESAFPRVKKGNKGHETGKDLAELLAAQSSGLCLIVVAGMEYAIYVKNKGYDVIDSAELVANKIINQLLGKIKI